MIPTDDTNTTPDDAPAVEMTTRGPGKFDSLVDEIAYAHTLHGCADDEAGDAEGPGWHGRVNGPLDLVEELEPGLAQEMNSADRTYLADHSAGAIVGENSQGFVSVEFYADAEALDSDWNSIVEHCDGFYLDDTDAD